MRFAIHESAQGTEQPNPLGGNVRAGAKLCLDAVKMLLSRPFRFEPLAMPYAFIVNPVRAPLLADFVDCRHGLTRLSCFSPWLQGHKRELG